MLKTFAVAAAVGTALLFSSAALAKDEAKKSGGKASLFATGDLNFKDTERPGVQIAAVQGDPSKGASKFFVKLPSGLSVPMHHHSADHFAVVVSGTMVFNIDGQDHTMPAGSYFAFTGKKQHRTQCTDPAGCTIFVDAHGKWDVLEEKAAAKK